MSKPFTTVRKEDGSLIGTISPSLGEAATGFPELLQMAIEHGIEAARPFSTVGSPCNETADCLRSLLQECAESDVHELSSLASSLKGAETIIAESLQIVTDDNDDAVGILTGQITS